MTTLIRIRIGAVALCITKGTQVFAGGCILSGFSYDVESVNYCTGIVCIKFTASGTGLHGNEIFCWNWGDESPQTCDAPNLVGDAWYSRTVCKSYDLTGSYTVTLSVSPAHTECITTFPLSFNENEGYVFHTACSGSSTGCIYFEPGADETALTYLWSNGSTGKNVCGLSRGSYTVTVTDKFGCSIAEQFMVEEPDPLEVIVDSLNCASDYARLSVIGGTPAVQNPIPFSENFDKYKTGTTSSSPDPNWISGQPAGDLIFGWHVENKQWKGFSLDAEAVWATTCIDVKYCKDSTSALEISLAKTCHDADKDDYIRVYASCNGGSEVLILAPPFENIPYHPVMCRFSASLPECLGCLKITIKAKRPDPGTGCVTQSVYGGCATVIGTTTTIVGGNQTALWMDSITVGCTPAAIQPYRYLWCEGTTTAENSNLPPNVSCGVTITDGNGCTAVDFVSCCAIGASASATPATCQGNCDGGATVTAGAGTAPFTFSWSDGQTGSVRSGLCAGLYQVTVTDAAGCSTAESVRIEAGVVEPMAQATDTTAICKNSGDSRQLSAGGGVSYSWSPGATLNDSTVSNPVASPTKTTRYFVTVTDANGCTGIGSVTVPVEDCSGLSPDLTNLSTLRLFPNPAASTVTVIVGGREHGILQVTLYNARGRAVAVAPVKGGQCAFDVSALPAGIYYAAAQGGEGFRTARVAVLH